MPINVKMAASKAERETYLPQRTQRTQRNNFKYKSSKGTQISLNKKIIYPQINAD